MRRIFFLIIGVVGFFYFFPKKETALLTKEHLIQVENKTAKNALFYAATIHPLTALVIPSPADGVILDLHFLYGQKVEKGQLLFTLSSGKFLNDYKTALLQYIKAKSDFNASQSQLSEADFLHKNLLISDDEYKTKKTSFYSNQLALLQAKDALQQLMGALSIKKVNLYDLSITEVNKISEALHFQKNTDILQVYSPASGMILSPRKSEEEIKKLNKGDSVKQGDTLALLGNMTGITCTLKVNELTVNQIVVGQKIKVTGVAFPDEILIGKINKIDREGEPSTNGLPNFAVEVMVPQLTAKQRKIIYPGMSAKIEIAIDEKADIRVPIAAVIEKNGKTYVKKYDTKLNEFKEVSVITGKTTEEEVVIEQGLMAGDQIALSY